MFVADGLEINTSFLGVNLLSSATRHAIAGGNVENLRAGPEIERLAKLFPDNLQCATDDGIIA